MADLIPNPPGPHPGQSIQPAGAEPTGEGAEAIIQGGTPQPFQPGQVQGDPSPPPWLTDPDAPDATQGEPTARRKIGPRGHSMGVESGLDGAAETLLSEIKRNASQLSASLFPTGPADGDLLSTPALHAYVRRHWNDPNDPQGSQLFRQQLLDQMAPKGPNGVRLAEGVRAYLRLYQQAVVAPTDPRIQNAPGPRVTDPEPAPQGAIPVEGQPAQPGYSAPPAAPPQATPQPPSGWQVGAPPGVPDALRALVAQEPPTGAGPVA